MNSAQEGNYNAVGITWAHVTGVQVLTAMDSSGQIGREGEDGGSSPTSVGNT